jgi:hypothetical protein
VEIVLSGTDVAFPVGFRNGWASRILGASDGDGLQISR